MAVLLGAVPPALGDEFTLGWYHNASGAAALDEMQRHGFDTIMDYELSHLSENGSSSVVHQELLTAEARQIGVQFHISADLIRSTAGANWTRLDSMINQYKSYGAVVSWQMADEPESSDTILPSVFAAAADRIRQLDPARPISTVFTKHDDRYEPYVPAVDIASVDNYPVQITAPNPNLRAYAQTAKRLVELAEPHGARTLFVVQAFTPDAETSEYIQPSVAQQRFLTYAPLTVGVEGLMYWTFYRNTPETRRDLVYPVTDSLTALIPALESTDVAPQVSSSGDGSSQGDGLADITYTVRQHLGSTFIIAANNTEQARPIDFSVVGTLPPTAIVDVVGENRVRSVQASPSSSGFSDIFQPYSVRVFEVIPAPSTTPGYWRFEEPRGPLAIDSAASPSENGLLKGGATRSSVVFSSAVPQTTAANVSSMQFDGVSGSVVNMGIDSDLDVGGGDFTLETFVRLDADGAQHFPLIAGKLVSGNFNDRGFELQARPDGSAGGEAGTGAWKALFRARDGAAASSRDLLSADLSFDTWYHLAAVRDGLTLRLYVDGVEASNMALGSLEDYSNPDQAFTIGGAQVASGAFGRAWDGLIDEVRLSREALSPGQFLNANVPEPGAALAAGMFAALSLRRRRKTA